MEVISRKFSMMEQIRLTISRRQMCRMISLVRVVKSLKENLILVVEHSRNWIVLLETLLMEIKLQIKV